MLRGVTTINNSLLRTGVLLLVFVGVSLLLPTVANAAYTPPGASGVASSTPPAVRPPIQSFGAAGNDGCYIDTSSAYGFAEVYYRSPSTAPSASTDQWRVEATQARYAPSLSVDYQWSSPPIPNPGSAWAFYSYFYFSGGGSTLNDYIICTEGDAVLTINSIPVFDTRAVNSYRCVGPVRVVTDPEPTQVNNLFQFWYRDRGGSNSQATILYRPAGGVIWYSTYFNLPNPTASNFVNYSSLPNNTTATEGNAANFSVSGLGGPGGASVWRQWQHKLPGQSFEDCVGTRCSGADTNNLSYQDVRMSENNALFREKIYSATDRWWLGPYGYQVKEDFCVLDTSLPTGTLTVQPRPPSNDPPVILVHPAPITVDEDDPAQFTVTLGSGTPPFTYQWEVDYDAVSGGYQNLGSPVVTGDMTHIYTVARALEADKGLYRVKISNAANPTGVTSNPARLSVNVGGGLEAPVITQQPTNQQVNEPDAAIFTVSASGSPAPLFQWQEKIGASYVNLTGETNAIFNTGPTDADIHNGKVYRVEVWNSEGTVRSVDVTLTVDTQSCLLDCAGPPVYTLQPVGGQIRNEGDPFSLIVDADGAQPIRYMWQYYTGGRHNSWAAVSGPAGSYDENNAVYTAIITGTYRALAENSEGTDAASQSAVISLEPRTGPPVITFHPNDVTLELGDILRLDVIVEGSQPFEYLWEKEKSPGVWEEPIYYDKLHDRIDTQSRVINFWEAQKQFSGNYRVTVRNAEGSMVSNTAEVRVTMPQQEIQEIYAFKKSAWSDCPTAPCPPTEVSAIDGPLYVYSKDPENKSISNNRLWWMNMFARSPGLDAIDTDPDPSVAKFPYNSYETVEKEAQLAQASAYINMRRFLSGIAHSWWPSGPDSLNPDNPAGVVFNEIIVSTKLLPTPCASLFDLARILPEMRLSMLPTVPFPSLIIFPRCAADNEVIWHETAHSLISSINNDFISRNLSCLSSSLDCNPYGRYVNTEQKGPDEGIADYFGVTFSAGRFSVRSRGLFSFEDFAWSLGLSARAILALDEPAFTDQAFGALHAVSGAAYSDTDRDAFARTDPHAIGARLANILVSLRAYIYDNGGTDASANILDRSIMQAVRDMRLSAMFLRRNNISNIQFFYIKLHTLLQRASTADPAVFPQAFVDQFRDLVFNKANVGLMAGWSQELSPDELFPPSEARCVGTTPQYTFHVPAIGAVGSKVTQITLKFKKNDFTLAQPPTSWTVCDTDPCPPDAPRRIGSAGLIFNFRPAVDITFGGLDSAAIALELRDNLGRSQEIYLTGSEYVAPGNTSMVPTSFPFQPHLNCPL